MGSSVEKEKKILLDSLQKKQIRMATNSPSFEHGEVIQRQLGITPINELIYERTIKFYESLDEHPNTLVGKSIQYPLGKFRKRTRPRDYLLEKTP